MRLWHQSITDLSRLSQYRQNLSEHASKVLSPDVTVEIHGLPAGIYGDMAPCEVTKYPYFTFLSERLICEAALTAEREGFEAMTIGCYLDPGLQLLRSLVNIPVLGITETSMLVACTLGQRFGVVTICPSMKYHLTNLAKVYGLTDRLSSIISMEPPVNEYDMEGDEQEAQKVEDIFHRACLKAIAQGADVIIPGEGVLNEFAFKRQIKSIEGAPVIDGNAVLWQYAVMMVNLQRTTGLGVSRLLTYPRASQKELEKFRSFHGLRPMAIEEFS